MANFRKTAVKDDSRLRFSVITKIQLTKQFPDGLFLARDKQPEEPGAGTIRQRKERANASTRFSGFMLGVCMTWFDRTQTERAKR